MKQANPRAAWVVQAWGANPRPQMIRNLPAGDMVVWIYFRKAVLSGEIRLLPGTGKRALGNTTGCFACC